MTSRSPAGGDAGAGNLALPLVQFQARPGVIDLGWGHPDPELLPVDALGSAAARATTKWGTDQLGYGAAQGPAPLLEAVAARLAEVDARAPETSSLVITAGASHALDLVLTLWTRPGDAVLVESPTYHIALKLLADHGLVPVPISRDAAGPDPVALEAALDDLAAVSRHVPLLYVIPTFHNPTGSLMPLDRRRALVALAERRGLLIVEDDAYRELSYDGPPPPSLWSLAAPGTVIRIASFSKTLAPGLRLGFLVGDRAAAERVAEGGLLDSGGGIAHYQGLTVAELMRSGAYAQHVERLRGEYRARRDALVESLQEHLPPEVSISAPGGGYFVWLTLPPHRSASSVLAASDGEGVSFVRGSVFAPSGGFESSLRLSFSRYSPDQLAEATRRLGRAYEAAD